MTSFHEAQRLQPPRFRWLGALPPAVLTAMAIEQRWLGHPLGAYALSDGGFASLSVFLWFVYVWLCRVQLVTDVDASALSIRLRGLLRCHRISLGAIRSASAVAFNAEREFGGYGFRAFPGGRAYVAQSASGVRLELQGGKFVVIGSEHTQELMAAITSRVVRTAPLEAVRGARPVLRPSSAKVSFSRTPRDGNVIR